MATATAKAPAPTKQKSARVSVREWVLAQVAGASEVEVPKLRQQAIAHFKAQAGFMDRLVTELLGELVYEEARRALASTRSTVIELGDFLTDHAGVTKRAMKLKHAWSGWQEHAGTRHVLLMDMTRDDLILAARERQARGRTEMAYGELWERLAMVLEDGETVRSRFTDEDIERIYQTIRAGGAVDGRETD
jgi:hypothetical protein